VSFPLKGEDSGRFIGPSVCEDALFVRGITLRPKCYVLWFWYTVMFVTWSKSADFDFRSSTLKNTHLSLSHWMFRSSYREASFGLEIAEKARTPLKSKTVKII
jgi:hypothetical protein